MLLLPACGRFGFEFLPGLGMAGPEDPTPNAPFDGGFQPGDGGDGSDEGSAPRPDGGAGGLDGGASPGHDGSDDGSQAGGGGDGGPNLPSQDAGSMVGGPGDAGGDVGPSLPDGGDTGNDATPKDVAGLMLWLDAADLSSLDADTDIATWRDRSGNGHDVSQSASARRPVSVNNARAGRSVVRFDGQDDYLEVANDGSFDSTDLTVLIVVSPRWTTHPNNNPSPFAIRTASATTRVSLHLDGNKADMHSWTSEGLSWAVYTFASDDFYLLEFIWSGNTESHYVNGAFINTDSRGLPASQVNHPVRIGAAEAGVEHWPGDIAEVLVYDRALSNGERVEVENYLIEKWQLTP